MKTSVSLCLALLAATSASAQVFRPETVNGAVLGGIAGAVIGNNSGSLNHNAWKGASIGAVAGGLIGSAVGADNDRRDTSVPVQRRETPYVYRDAGPGHVYGGYRRSAARDGLVLGAVAGGIIGHNSGSFRHNGWRGAAWGAGAGWILGSVIDYNRSYYGYGYDYPRRPVIWERPVYVESAPATVVQQAPAQPVQPAAPQQVTIINNYYGTNPAPMTQANSLFGR